MLNQKKLPDFEKIIKNLKRKIKGLKAHTIALNNENCRDLALYNNVISTNDRLHETINNLKTTITEKDVAIRCHDGQIASKNEHIDFLGNQIENLENANAADSQRARLKIQELNDKIEGLVNILGSLGRVIK